MRPNKSVLFASVVLVLAAFATTACTAPSSDEGTEAETTSSALKNTGHGGGGGLSFSCSGLVCTCSGDADCNDMFTNGGCGDVSSCDDSGPDPVCWCFRGIGRTTPKGDGGVKAPPAVSKHL